MGSGLGVVTAELDRLATGMEGNPWFSPSVHVVAPDELQVAKSAAANLNENARLLERYQKWAEAENRRTAEMLRIAAKAYDDIDERYADNFDDPARSAELEAVSVPVPATPMPTLPDGSAGMRPLTAGDYSDVNTTQRLLSGGDHGVSLDVAEVHWRLASDSAQAHAAPPAVTNWEGDAADAARDRMTTFSAWLQDLSGAWQRLSAAAVRVQASHTAALAEHTNIYTRYKFLEARMQELTTQTDRGNAAAMHNEMARIAQEMAELQRRSDEVREEYANNATFDPVQVGRPPFAESSGTPGAAGSGGAGGGPPGGDPTAMGNRMAQSLGQPATSGTPAGAGPPPGGAPTGAASRGGTATGAPNSGGTAPVGSPTGAPSAAAPTTARDPRLRPAAVSGGAGSHGGAGGGGGGLPSDPMSAAVKAKTVAVAPTIPAAAGPPPGSVGGAAMGGVGPGMAPMAHGAGSLPGKEKRRDPRLAPDEDLYTEDRPWTEAVVGQQRRRRDDQEKSTGGGREGGDSQ